MHRDAGLSRLRRLTATVSLGAAGLTVAASLLAATSNPGRSPSASQPDQQSNGSGSAVAPSGDGQPGLTSPNQPPQPGSDGGPVAVSGGS
jgi:hypothetical protein